MPNLIPIATDRAVRAMLHEAIVLHECLDALRGIATAPRDDARFSQADHLAYSTAVAVSRLHPDKSARFSAPRHDEAGPLTAWNPAIGRKPRDNRKHSLSGPRLTDADVRARQWSRITGIVGVAMPSRSDYRGGKKGEGRMLSARGKATTNVPVHLSAAFPDYRDAVVPEDGTDITITGGEVRYLRRYKDAMRGDAFAAAMEAERLERNEAYWRAAFPWWPLNAKGKRQACKWYTRPDGVSEAVFHDGKLMSEYLAEWGGDDVKRTMTEAERLREIDALVMESKREQQEDAARWRKVRRERIAQREALSF